MNPKWLLWMVVFVLATACASDKVGITVYFDRPAGLAQGDRVLFEKNEAGTVRAVEKKPDGRFVIGLEVPKSFSHALTQDSRFHVIDDPARDGSKAVDIRLSRRGGVALDDGATVKGVSPHEEATVRLQEELEKGLHFLERQLHKYGRDLEDLPKRKEYQRFKESLREWADEVDRMGEQAREKLENQWLPKMRRELEEFKKWLRENGREEDRRQQPEEDTLYV